MAFLFLFSTFIELGLETGSGFSPKKTEPLYVAFLYHLKKKNHLKHGPR